LLGRGCGLLANETKTVIEVLANEDKSVIEVLANKN
jgi:hypothetical protein